MRQKGRTHGRASAIDRFYSKVRFVPGGCWHWEGGASREGYGHFRLSGRSFAVHRITYTLAYGRIPDGYAIDHLCRTTDCVNPLHLDACTPGENVKRGLKCSVQTCKRGHRLDDPNNVYRHSGRRFCIACFAVRDARYKAERETREKAGNDGTA